MKLFYPVDRLLIFVAKFVLFMMVILTSLDAIGRYFLSMPINGAFELTEMYLLPLIIFLSIATTWKEGGHVRITIFYDKMPEKVKKILDCITLLAGIGFFFLITYQGFISTYEAWINNYEYIGLFVWPVYLQQIWVPVGAGAACLYLINDLCKRINLSVSIPKIVIKLIPKTSSK